MNNIQLVSHFISILLVASCVLCIDTMFCTHAIACEGYAVRDAAFNEERDIHRLAVMGKGTITSEDVERLQEWIESFEGGLNIEVVSVDADDPDVNWKEYGIPSAPPSFPVTVLAGWNRSERRSFFLEYWEPYPSDEELKILLDSPIRKEIRETVGSKLALLLYVPGNAPNSDFESTISAIAEQWSEKETLPVSVFRVDRGDARARILLSFLGLKKDGPDWVGIVFGKGKLMRPREGREDLETYLNQQITILTGDCSCLRNASSLGVDLPMIWSKELDEKVMALRSHREGVFPWGPVAAAGIEGMDSDGGMVSSLVWTLICLTLFVVAFTGALLYRRQRNGRPYIG